MEHPVRATFAGPSTTAKVLVFVSCLFACRPAFSVDRDRTLSELYHTAWSFQDGAPAEIHALAQTTDGFLWLGATTGLFRFDGVRFQPYKPQSGQTFPQRN